MRTLATIISLVLLLTIRIQLDSQRPQPETTNNPIEVGQQQ
jgi:hypothetical protein